LGIRQPRKKQRKVQDKEYIQRRAFQRVGTFGIVTWVGNNQNAFGKYPSNMGLFAKATSAFIEPTNSCAPHEQLSHLSNFVLSESQ